MIVQRRAEVARPDGDLLRPGKGYSVYAILFELPNKFLVYEEQALSFPFFVSLESIELVDASLPHCFHYSPPLPSTEAHSSRSALLAFPEMAGDRLFYQTLVDGDEKAKHVWQRVKRSIDAGASR